MKSLFEQELLNAKELRFIEVSIIVNQVDFRLSTPRTRWDLRTPVENATQNIPPVTLSLFDIKLDIVDPIVPACHIFDRVRSTSWPVCDLIAF